MLIVTAPEEVGLPECADTVEAAGLKGPHRWGVILPNSSRVSLLTYKAIVAVRYPELVAHGHGPLQIGHFVANDQTVETRRFPCCLLGCPQRPSYCSGRHHGAVGVSQEPTQEYSARDYKSAPSLVQPHSSAEPTPPAGLRVPTSSSAAGATALIAVIVQTGCAFLSGGRRGAFFSVQRLLTFARSFNTFSCMLHRTGKLTN